LPGLSLGVADGKINHLPDEEIEIRYW
jgi:hypothetical protein